MSDHPLIILGIGADGLKGLTEEALDDLRDADMIFGGKRHLAFLAKDNQAKLMVWPDPFSEIYARLDAFCPRPHERGFDRKLVLLASGDPLCFGVGTLLVKRYGINYVRIIPFLSSETLARSRLGWSRAESTLLSLCGRPLAVLKPYLSPSRKLLVFCSDQTTCPAVADLLHDQGLGQSRLTLMANLGSHKEEQISFLAEDMAKGLIHAPILNEPLVLLAIECAETPSREHLSLIPGRPDETFHHDGQISKREARALALCALAPCYGERLIDFGAGAGSVAIEWLRSTPATSALAIEYHEGRRLFIEKNAEALGVPHLEIWGKDNLDALDDLGISPDADAFFIGGGLSALLLERLIPLITPGKRLVCHAVTLNSEQLLMTSQQHFGGRLTRLSLARAEAVGSVLGWRPAMPLTQWVYRP